MNKNFISSINNRNEPEDELSKVSPLINQMKLIDEHMKELFLNFDEENINDHDSFLLFRGKISKRIVDYSNLLARFETIVGRKEMSPDIKVEFDYHSKNLKSCKRKLGTWWKKCEKKYHQLCLKIFLEQKENLTKTEKTENLEELASKMNLEDTKKMMIDEVNRMKNVKSELVESSDKLKKQSAIFNSFETKIRSSAQLIVTLKKKAETDTKYVWYSFFFFLTVCVYIVLRRLGFIRAILAIIKLIVSVFLFFINNFLKFITVFRRSTLQNIKTVEVVEVTEPVFTSTLNATIPTHEL